MVLKIIRDVKCVGKHNALFRWPVWPPVAGDLRIVAAIKEAYNNDIRPLCKYIFNLTVCPHRGAPKPVAMGGLIEIQVPLEIHQRINAVVIKTGKLQLLV